MFKKRGHKKEYQGFFSRNKLWMASATLMGTVIGAGVLGIPYVIAQSGLTLGIINLVVVGFALLVLHLCLGEISLRTKGFHQLSGYMEKYLGKAGKHFMAFSMIVGIYGAMTAYIIGEGEILKTIFGGHPLIYSLVFFVLVSVIIYSGLKATGRAEMIVTALMVLIVLVIGIFSFDKINTSHFVGLHWANIFLPYGVILFAFVGTAAIPELREELEGERHKMKKAIFIGSAIPIIIYLFFAVVVIGLVGLSNFNSLAPNDRIATIALALFANPTLGLAANIFAIFAMFTSFLGLGLALKQMYEYDYHFKKYWAYALTIIPPVIIAVSGLTHFIAVLGFTGAIAGGVDGILIMLAYWKAKRYGERKPEYTLKIGKIITGLLILMFSLGIIYQLWKTLF
ncbi:MAG: amino acid permease [Nanoarchaeota archaeon]|nr:amino acid permease [Nanoarchaeota archaeon]